MKVVKRSCAVSIDQRLSQTLINCATKSFAQNRLVLHSSLPLEALCGSMCKEPTIRLPFGTVPWSHIQMCQPLISEVGLLMPGCRIEIDWTDQKPAPDELLELTHCGCRSGCSTNRCSCKKAQLQCTDACSCTGCVNNSRKEESEADSEQFETDDELSDGSDSSMDEI